MNGMALTLEDILNSIGNILNSSGKLPSCLLNLLITDCHEIVNLNSDSELISTGWQIVIMLKFSLWNQFKEKCLLTDH